MSDNKIQNVDLSALNGLSPEERKLAIEMLKEIADTGKSELLEKMKYGDFEEIPVDIHTFLHDRKYLGNGLYDQDGRFTLFPYWEETLKKIFPDNITTAYNTLILTGSIGIGKSTCAVICQLYMLYRLLCLKDPYLYYGMQPIDKITISLMNITIENAKGVALDKLNQLILSSDWFMSHGEMHGTTNMIFVPDKHIEFVCASSNNQIIGRALFCNFSDEVNFDARSANVERQKARLKQIISQVDARMASRFLRGDFLPTLNIIASSKASDQSFLDDYIETKRRGESKTTLIIDEPQWVVDSRKQTGKWFKVAVGDRYLPNELIPEGVDVETYRAKGYTRIIDVPSGYLEKFKDNIELALTDIAGISTASATKYISGISWNAIKADYENPFIKEIIEVGNSPDDHAQYANFFDLSKVPNEWKSRPMWIHLDMSSGSLGKGDKTGIAGVWIKGKRPSVEGEDITREMYYRVAFSVSIKAPKGFSISFMKHRNFIRWLRDQGFAIKGISCDTWGGPQMQQELKADGFDVTTVSVDRVDSKTHQQNQYAYFKTTMTDMRLDVYKKCDFLTEEVLGLERLSDGHIEHPDAGKSGCFTGDTKVSLVDGRELTFLELVNEFNNGKENYVYSFNHQTKKIEPKLITKAWCTQKNTALIEVELDNGETLQCTPNHKFMLRDGSYKEAKDLTENDSLMPLYRKYPSEVVAMKNYRMYYEPIEDKWHYEHRQFANEVLDEKYLVHHKNCNRDDNTPTNLIWCSKQAHLNIHKQLQTGAHSQQAKDKRNASLKAWYNDPQNAKILEQKHQKLHKVRLQQIGWTEEQFLARQAKKEAKKQHGLELRKLAAQNKLNKELYIKDIETTFNVNWEALTAKEKDSYAVKYQRLKNPETQTKISKAVSENHKLNKYENAYKALSKKNEESRMLKELVPTVDRDKFKEIFGFDYDSLPARAKGAWCVKYRRIVGKTILNHKVKAVRFIDKTADVYDITVQDNHNFALSAGIFVHNSKDQIDAVVGALWNASQNAEEYAYNYGDNINAALDVSLASSSEKDRQQLVIDYQEELKKIYFDTYKELDEVDLEKKRKQKEEYEYLKDISDGIFCL